MDVERSKPIVAADKLPQRRAALHIELRELVSVARQVVQRAQTLRVEYGKIVSRTVEFFERQTLHVEGIDAVGSAIEKFQRQASHVERFNPITVAVELL